MSRLARVDIPYEQLKSKSLDIFPLGYWRPHRFEKILVRSGSRASRMLMSEEPQLAARSAVAISAYWYAFPA